MLNMGFFNKGWYGMCVACGMWCLADVSSISPLSEQTEGLWGNSFPHNPSVCSDEG